VLGTGVSISSGFVFEFFSAGEGSTGGVRISFGLLSAGVSAGSFVGSNVFVGVAGAETLVCVAGQQTEVGQHTTRGT